MWPLPLDTVGGDKAPGCWGWETCADSASQLQKFLMIASETMFSLTLLKSQKRPVRLPMVMRVSLI